jgi:integral membrane protein (TIGR00529 family)
MLSPSLSLLISIAGILILLRFKVHAGISIFIGSIILSILVLPLDNIPILMRDSIIDYQTIRLLVIIASALTLSKLMEIKGLLANLATAIESISPKLALHMIPAVIGLVPMPAGALVSGTASKGTIDRMKLEPEQATFINYWFRHIWEFSIPVYPAVVLTSVVIAVSLSKIVITLLPMTLLAIVSGSLISYTILKNKSGAKGKPSKNILIKLLKASWPILILVASILLGLDAIIAFPVTLALLMIQQKSKWSEVKASLKYGLDIKILFMLYAVMLYRVVIEQSGAVESVFSDMQNLGLPVLLILIVLPLLMGLATGFSVVFAGIALPLLVPYIVTDAGMQWHALLVAYTSGFLGVLLSPVHLCLILSAEYFKASLGRVYRYLIPLYIIVEGIVVTVYLMAG